MTVSPPGTPQGHHTAPGVLPDFAPASPAFSAGPPSYAPPTQGRRSILTAVGTTITLLIAISALIMAVIAVSRPSPSPVASAPSTTTNAATDTADVDRALCSAIASLMAEDDKRSNAFIATGAAGSPERDQAQSKFRSDTEDWAERIQPQLEAHIDANPFFKRTLQRFIDDRLLLVRNMRPGPLKEYDSEIWSDSLAAYGGPLSVCQGLGIKW